MNRFYLLQGTAITALLIVDPLKPSVWCFEPTPLGWHVPHTKIFGEMLWV